jgi:hypothetical protein
MQIKRRGVEMRLVIKGNGSPPQRADLALLKAIARAHQWSEDLLTGRARSIAEIADRAWVGDRHVRQNSRLFGAFGVFGSHRRSCFLVLSSRGSSSDIVCFFSSLHPRPSENRRSGAYR